MRVLFIQKDIFARPAIMSLSAVLKREGHECDLLIDDLEKNVIKKALALKPDIIAFSITTGEYSWMSRTGSEIRREFTGSIICGGPHPTFYPDIIDDEYLDAICRGEGEDALADFVNATETNRSATGIPNFLVKYHGEIHRNDVRPLIENLDGIPFPDRQLYSKYRPFRVSRDNILFHTTIQTSRGCPYQCAFCFNKRYNELYRGKGRIVRRKSVSNVIEELGIMKQDRKLKFLSIEDDSFLLHPGEWLHEFLQRYREEIAIPFKILASADQVDEDIIRRLKDAGCYSMRMGVETGNEELRRSILQKKVSNEELIQASSLAKCYGIRLQTFNILGIPGGSIDSALETFDFNRKTRPDFVWCSLLNPYPGTDIFDYAVDHGYISDDFDYRSIGHSYFIDTPIKLENKTAIRNLQKLMYLAILFHLPEGFLRFLIKLPLTRFYSFMFGLTFLYGLCRMDRTSPRDLLKLPLGRLLRYA